MGHHQSINLYRGADDYIGVAPIPATAALIVAVLNGRPDVMAPPGVYRIERQVDVYRDDDRIAFMFTPTAAQLVIEAMNARSGCSNEQL